MSNPPRSYGLEVLFLELTKQFFVHLNKDSPSNDVHLYGFQYNKLNNKNPFVCLALFVLLQLCLLVGWCLICWKKLLFTIMQG
jgi:hypothetical protein